MIKKVALIVLSASLLCFTHTEPAFAVSYTFGSSSNLSNVSSPATATTPQVLANGSNVFVIWRDTTTGSGDIYFERSTDGGATFNGGTSGSPGSPVNLGANTGSSTVPQIAVAGSNVYVVWQDATTGGGDIYFERSTDSGATFNGGTSGSPGSPVNLSSNSALSQTPQLSASGTNVYVVWTDSTTGSGDIYFERSTDSGATFNGGTSGSPGSPVNLSANTGSSTIPQIKSSGSNVYVVWQDATTGGGDIYFERSTDGGATFNGGTSGSPGSPVNLSSNSALSQTPQLSASDSNVYVVWRDTTTGSGDIYFERSTDGGATFNGGTSGSPGSPVNLGANTGSSTLPQVKSSGSNVYVVWQDATTGGGDIYFERSTDSGATFNGGTSGSPGAIVNLSLSNTGASITPQLSISGSNVYVVWRDATPGNNDIFFTASSDSGATFNGGTSGSPGNPTNISNTSASSTTPQVSSLGAIPYVVWSEGTSSPINILIASASGSSTQVSLDKTQYKLSDTATLTVTSLASNTNPSVAETISATVKSTSDTTGVTVTLTETGVNTGTFSGSFAFTTGSSSGTSLKTSPGDTITATFSGQSGTATIFSRTVSFDFSTYTMSSLAIVTVTDQNSVTNSATVETIQANVKSTTTPSGISLTLTETGAGTGIFKNTDLIFTTGTAQFQVTDTATVTQKETSSGQATNNVIDTLSVTVKSTTDSVGLTLPLTETGPNTGFFDSTLRFTTTGSSSGNVLKVSTGDIIGVTYLGETTRGLVIPNSNSGIGALPSAIGDTITATYQGSTGTATINPGSGGGGGGGGLIRPGLVLDVIAIGGGPAVSPSLDLSRLVTIPGAVPDIVRNLVLNHDPFKPIPPIKDNSLDLPLSIDGNGYALAGNTNTIATEKKDTGKPIDVLLDFLSSNEIVHAGFYMNLPHDSDDLYKSDTYIIYEKGEPLQIVDPHKFFDNVKFNITKSNMKNIIDYKIIFAKPMNKSDIDFRIWDERRSSADTRILDALQVVGVPSITNASSIIPNNQSNNITGIINPKNSTTTSSVNKTDDIMSAIKDWGGYSSTPISDSELLHKVGLSGKHIPSWFMKTTRWIVDGNTSVKEFLDVLQYMHDKNMTGDPIFFHN